MDSSGAPIELFNLDECVDVVYSYKCKFCDFTGSSPQEISNHVVHEHVIPKKADDKAKDMPLVLSSEVTHSVAEPAGGKYAPVETAVQVSTNNTGVIDAESLVTHISAQLGSLPAAPSNAESGDQVVAIAEDGQSIGDLRELFVCAQCTVAFTSMEECQTHLANAHNVTMGDAQEEEREFVGENLVSIATQVELTRKPGRKRKSEKNALEKECRTEVQSNLHGTDLSLITRRLDGADGKRKVRPPTRLISDYVIHKRKNRRSHKRRLPKLMCPRKSCRARFRTRETLDLHERCHQRAVGDLVKTSCYKCTECEFGCVQWKVMQMHMWTEHKIDVALYKCPYCSFRADVWHKVEVHIEGIHEANDEEETMSLHEDDYSLETPESSEKPPKPNKVELRNVTGQREESQPRKRSRKDSRRLVPECKICGRVFANVTILRTHTENVHEKHKPFTCEYCGYSTGRKAMLQLHMRMHTGEKPFKCDLCQYQASDHNTLRRHRMRHTGDRPYKCAFCKYACIQSTSLKTHMKNKHPGATGVFTCDLCPYNSVNKANYTQHMEDHKRGLIEVPRRIKKETNLVITGDSLMNLVPSSNVISLAASESQLISPSETVALQSNAGQQQEVKQELEQPQEEEQLQQPIHIAPPGSFAIEAGQEHQWMVADGDTQVILAVQTGGDGQEYLVSAIPSSSSNVLEASQISIEQSMVTAAADSNVQTYETL